MLIPPALPAAEQARRAQGAGARFVEEGARLDEASPGSGTFAVLFTSGTTGEAKKVRISRDAVAAALDGSAARLGWRDEDRWGLFLPPAHIGGLSVLLRCLRAGRTVVLWRLSRVAHSLRHGAGNNALARAHAAAPPT